ncbi:MAG: methylated-DNA--[protein]-cysteine S-methyltransferase [Alphaproteobacteria bacterium]|nr:methylated-DNA--[protein]-cysteine S-methyltransferase [Alphaproteobacteria bacterium]
MTTTGFALFDTEIGACAIIWADGGIIGMQLPERRDEQARARLAKRYPGASEAGPPPEIESVIAEVQALLRGEARDLAGVSLDMDAVPEFERKVYEIARAIPPGRTMTYGEIATRLGDKALSRDVGAALGRNPFPIVVPCHRVLGSSGKAGGFSARGGVDTKMRMLQIEGAKTSDEPSLFDSLPVSAKKRN